MQKTKIGISVGGGYRVPVKELLSIVKGAGFDAVSPEYSASGGTDTVIEAAREMGLAVQSVHAPFGKAADMWKRDRELSDAALAELLRPLELCSRCGVPIMVVHAWIGFDYKFDPEELSFEAFDKLVSEAKRLGVKIAFENTEGEEYLFALLDRYRADDTVGFCWDSGHEMCYNRSRDLIKDLKDRLLVTHLNDNLGISREDGVTFWTDDLHLLPYDGICDWDNATARLKTARPLEILNFELSINSKPNRRENDIYAEMGLCAFFAEAYKRAKKIADKYSK